MSVICEQCDKSFEQLGKHWSHNSSCTYPNFSNEQNEIISGVLMGDGCLNIKKNKKSRLVINMTNKEYLSYVSNKFGRFSNGISLARSASESFKQAVNSGFSPNAVKENYSNVYRLEIMSHPEFQHFEKWYKTGKKVWPKNIDLTPTTLKHWYCGDGHFDNSGSNRFIEIEMSNESENTDKITNIFESSGLPEPSNYSICSRENDRVDCTAQFTVSQSNRLWKYMGNHLPGFEYKWPEEYRNN